MESSETKLINFISDITGMEPSQINSESLIESDIGVTGEDAEDLIKQFAKKFRVNINQFDFAKYFYEEPTFSIVFNHNSQTLKPFAVKHLEKAIKAGRLDDEIINS